MTDATEMTGRARFRDMARRLGPATRVRQARAFGGSVASPRQPVIVKSISVQHGRDGARATLRYVARLRESDRDRGDAEPQLYDEWGDPVGRGLALEALDAWALPDERSAESNLARALRAAEEDSAWSERLAAFRRLGEARNLEAAARERRRTMARDLARSAGIRVAGERAAAVLDRAAELAEHGVRVGDLEPARRYGRVATRHLAASVPLADERQAGLFEIAVAAFVREAFAAEGRAVLWALHVEHGKEVHAHLLVRNFDDDGRALAMDREGTELDRLREALARHARGLGIDVEATRHGDRPELVAAVADGAVALPRPGGRREGARGSGVDKLEAVAPGWLAVHGPAYAQRLLARALGRPDPAEAPTQSPAAEGYGKLVEVLAAAGVFGSGPEGVAASARAVGLFAALRGEEVARTGRDSLARWYLGYAPLLFGPARRGRRVDPATLAAVYRGLPAVAKTVVLGAVDADRIARVSRELSVIHEVRRNAHRRVVDLARLARQREQLARRLEGFGSADDLRAAVALRTSAAALTTARAEARRMVEPLRSVADRDPLRDRGRGG